MKICIRQIRGNSGTDVWANTLSSGLQRAGHQCVVDLRSILYQFVPADLSLLKNEKEFGIIHGNSWNAYAFKEGCPLVVTEHLVVHDPAYNPYRTFPQKIFHHWIYRCEQRSFEAADAVVCVSDYSKEKVEDAFGCSNCKRIYNGIDTDRFSPSGSCERPLEIPDNKIVLFFAGNLSTRKGADLLPSIMNQLDDRFILVLASGYQHRTVHENHRIINLGHLNLASLINMYNICDIFLTPTRLEGFGLSIAEAMSCAKPVVATNCSSIPELVVDEKGGFLCEIDDVDMFSKRIRYLSENPDVREQMGKFNRERVLTSFTQSQMVKNYLQLYQSLIE